MTLEHIECFKQTQIMALHTLKITGHAILLFALGLDTAGRESWTKELTNHKKVF